MKPWIVRGWHFEPACMPCAFAVSAACCIILLPQERVVLDAWKALKASRDLSEDSGSQVDS